MRLRFGNSLSVDMRCAATVLVLTAGISLPSFAQSGEATLAGVVEDPSGALIPNAPVRITNVDTGITVNSKSNGRGLFTVSGLTPGRYSLHAQHDGFAGVEINNITLNVGDQRRFEVKLPLSQSQQVVQVDGDTETINTSNATVSTVIDREFVNDIPLNGRSFQTLILLAPGVVTSSPQGGDDGEFSINGQRTNANYYMLDGLSANNQASQLSGSATAGMSPNATALGTTQAILPVDALQEFRIATSTFPAEFGRQPGGSINFQSRSGTNRYHGGLFDYVRNNAFDANNWFNTYTTPIIARPAEHQNDFGGFVGGPLGIPKLFSGRDRLFFFFAYEGMRVILPQAATVYYVPSNGTYSTGTASDPRYLNMRANAPAALRPALNAFPLPNCTVARNPQCVDGVANGLSPYLFSSSTPGSLNTIAGRTDAQVTPRIRLFARYNDSTSSTVSYLTSGPDLVTTTQRSSAYVLGADFAFHGSLLNTLRLQYAPSSRVINYSLAPLGGAQPVNLQTMQGLPALGGETQLIVETSGGGEVGKIYTLNYGARQFQPNGVDTFSWAHGAHFFKAGVDYRQTRVYMDDGKLARGPGAYYFYESPTQMVGNEPQEIETFNTVRQDPTTRNLGLFFQDEWRIHKRLTLSLGLRWDVNPPPTISGAQQYTYTGDITKPSTMALSQLGAPLYKTTYTNVQPRFGTAYVAHDQSGHMTVVRGGIGLYYDTIALGQTIGSGFSYGAGSHKVLTTSSTGYHPFPMPASAILIPFQSSMPYGLDLVADPHVVPPSSLHWNVAVQQELGPRQNVTLGYVGSTGKNLIFMEEYPLTTATKQSNGTSTFGTIRQYQNGPGSNYNALQASYKLRPTRGLQAMASYTWAHAIDWSSTDNAILTRQRGNSNHDVRNNFTAAFVYNAPGYVSAGRTVQQLTSNWSFSLMMVSRSGFPVNVTGPTVVDPATGDEYPSRVNYNGSNPYVHVNGIPGGRQFNAAAFSVPTSAQAQVGNSPRNFLRGFGETAANVAIQRRFILHDSLSFQLRAEAFNVLNHPNFGALNVSCGTSTLGAKCTNSLMGQATSMISDALVGANAIYQQGGPRSLQLTARLQF